MVAPDAPEAALNCICPYYTMFPLGFPLQALAQATPGEWVLDPFCGRGTTLFAARLMGLPSVGIDSNPVAAAVSAAKLVHVSPEAVAARCVRILRSGPIDVEAPEGEFWEVAYHRDTLADVCRLREHFLHECTLPEDIALRALMLGILHGPRTKSLPSYLSNQMPRTYSTKPAPALRFWHSRGLLKPERVDVAELVARKARHFFGSLPAQVEGTVRLADSRELDPSWVGRSVKWVVTSPPYYGMRTYRPDQWLRNWFLGGPPRVEYCQEGQISHRGREQFVQSIAEVWRRVADVCCDGAQMVVRFGAIPSTRLEPASLFEETVHAAHCGWRVVSVQKAGAASDGRRQASQFAVVQNRAREEIDIRLTLER